MNFTPDSVRNAMPLKKQWLGWVRYLWLVYLVFFLMHPVFDHVSWKEWVATGLGLAAFLFLYFAFFRSSRPWNHLCLAGMVLMGIGFAPFNPGASAFFIYPSCFIPFAVGTELTAVELLAVVLAIIGVESWLLHLPAGFYLPAAFFSVFLGAGNIFFAQRNRSDEKLRMAKEEIERLAKIAERERIARDLHDVLGHTLSVIILKSELAGKLIDRDPKRAKAEIGDVEKTSRAALADVRNTIRGYRSHSLEAELKHAQAVLGAAGVTLQAQAEDVGLNPAQESVVALVVREAITNVVRHSRARHCLLKLAPVNGACRLEIQDDGCGGPSLEGSGLRGMRERVEALGGTLQRENGAGTRLIIHFPLAQSKENGCR
jgi:two-component system, NarL family, sensor histidine kinase DesK